MPHHLVIFVLKRGFLGFEEKKISSSTPWRVASNTAKPPMFQTLWCGAQRGPTAPPSQREGKQRDPWQGTRSISATRERRGGGEGGGRRLIPLLTVPGLGTFQFQRKSFLGRIQLLSPSKGTTQPKKAGVNKFWQFFQNLCGDFGTRGGGGILRHIVEPTLPGV